MTATALLYMKLSSKAEVPLKKIKNTCFERKAKKIVTKNRFLFALDSLGSGFLTSALVSFYLTKDLKSALKH